MKLISSVSAEQSGVACSMPNALMRVTYVAPHIVRVRCTREKSFSEAPSSIVLPRERRDQVVDIQDGEQSVDVSSGRLRVCLDKTSGCLRFLDEHGAILFREPSDIPRVFEEVTINEVNFELHSAKMIETVDGGRVEATVTETGKTTRAWTVRQHFAWTEGEALYGLGSHEEDVLNLRGTMQYLYQQNMKAVVPVLVSSKGYAILFDADCELEFHDDEQGSFVKLDAVRELDYYVVYGPEFDTIVAGYRALTGRVPMLPRWAFGYCQSKERYSTQQELIGIVEAYRHRGLPLDLIIQDWMYWPTGWGIKEFDAERYPDPTAMCKRIHELNAHIMISIWPSVKGEHPEAEAMKAAGLMLKNNVIYDAFSQEARDRYWEYANDGLFKHGIDAWWCDCTEPAEADWNGSEKLSPAQRREINTKALRELLGQEQVNAYSLFHSKGIYENQRKTTNMKRVINLTRSAYAGQQRYGTITWSGDIAARWEVLAQQIPSGLNFTATGCPYWTNDIGAFFVNRKSQWFWNGEFPNGCDDLGYRELYTRWFQYGAFLPMFRSHGTDTPREIWRFGKPGEIFYDTLVKYLRLRYRLLPYIYSLAGMTTQEHYTMMRALAFDFRADVQALDIKNQYMFGPAFMVCPVTSPMYYGPESKALRDTPKTRAVYLPTGTHWYDFWTGARHAGGQIVTADAPIETMPLYARAGSIVLMGPDIQFSDEKIDGDWTIRIYPGADACFTVYEDSGDGYGYEDGEFSTWDMKWDDEAARFRIGKRRGEFPGMIKSRNLDIKVMRDASGIGDAPSSSHTTYTGEEIEIAFH